ncbi:hypothetical protein BKA24_001660 [Microbacterium marinum]|uniref:Uncharacterized protein n=1 Tax=Microbacterium marinum TaxID=421115 RepID=A0A7W7FI18_9MICO|nr:hypothetical protein [Microbacterium marinum]MBB4666951.1 hypothetical protein [Microbacterium marinum]
MTIELPVDDAPSRIHRMPTAAPSPEDVTHTLAEYERLAISTGDAVAIGAPEFTSDGETWSALWLGDRPPVGARVVVHRAGAATHVTRSWVESAPADEIWLDLWTRRPMTLFGASTIRAALARAFRDVIGTDKREPDDMRVDAPIVDPAVWEAAVVPRPEIPTPPRPEVPTPPRPEVPRPPRPAVRPASVAVPRPPSRGVHRLEDVVLPAAKPGSARKSKSRGSRDSGKRQGGQR